MARIEKAQAAYPSVEKFLADEKAKHEQPHTPRSHADDLDASYRARVAAVLDATCRPWFQHENVARQSLAPHCPIASTRLKP